MFAIVKKFLMLIKCVSVIGHNQLKMNIPVSQADDGLMPKRILKTQFSA